MKKIKLNGSSIEENNKSSSEKFTINNKERILKKISTRKSQSDIELNMNNIINDSRKKYFYSKLVYMKRNLQKNYLPQI